MGILDEILGTESKSYRERPPEALKIGVGKETPRPISMSVRFLPLRLAMKKESKVDMIVRITNETNEKQLVSFEALAPKAEMIGFDSTVINKQYEKKLGYVEPGASVEFAATVYGTTQTKAGNCPISITAYVHYLDYKRVINYVKRNISLRIV